MGEVYLYRKIEVRTGGKTMDRWRMTDKNRYRQHGNNDNQIKIRQTVRDIFRAKIISLRQRQKDMFLIIHVHF